MSKHNFSFSIYVLLSPAWRGFNCSNTKNRLTKETIVFTFVTAPMLFVA